MIKNKINSLKQKIKKIFIYFSPKSSIDIKLTEKNTFSVDSLDFEHFTLEINPNDFGGKLYKEKTYFYELINPVEKEIVKQFNPNVYIDIGANYGFTSLVYNFHNPHKFIIAVEPSPILIPYLEKNLKNNHCNYKIINAACSNNTNKIKFSLNTFSSQDNRVLPSPDIQWQQVDVSSTTLSEICEVVQPNDFVYIKIDTQGFEERVFNGGKVFLNKNNNWIIRSEFAPDWLISQGTNPVDFLKQLIQLYVVIELPKRCRFKGESLNNLIEFKLNTNEVEDFVKYISDSAKGKGWCDLLILPLNLLN